MAKIRMTANLISQVMTGRKTRKRRRRRETVWTALSAPPPPPHKGFKRCKKRHGITVVVTIRGEVCDASFTDNAQAHREIGKRVKRRVGAGIAVFPMAYSDFRLDSRMSVRVKADPKVKPKKKYKGKGDYEN
jgi:hypothetical protein